MNGFIRCEGVSHKWRRECRYGMRHHPSKCVATIVTDCDWCREHAMKNKFRDFVVIWVVCASQSVSQLWGCLLPAKQMTLIKNENIINSTTLFFVVGVVVIARVPLLLLCRSCSVIGRMCHGLRAQVLRYPFFSSHLSFRFPEKRQPWAEKTMLPIEIYINTVLAKERCGAEGKRVPREINIFAHILTQVMKF